MVDVNASKALEDEIRFLGQVRELAEKYYGEADNRLSAAIFEGWVQGVRRHAESNREMIDAEKSGDFDAWAREEEKLMDAFTATAHIARESVRTGWLDYLEDEKRLLSLLRGAA